MHLKKIKFFVKLLFIFFVLLNKSNAETVSSDKSISDETETAQQNIDTAEVTLTITNSTVSRANTPIKVDSGLADVSISIDSDSTVKSTSGDNPILGINTTRLSVDNSGTISSSNGKSIDIYKSTDAEISNNSGAVISAAKNAIRTGGTTGDPTTGYTITNSGQIYSTNTTNSAIFSNVNSTGGTITNNSGGQIYSSGSQATLKAGATTTITNSGSIKNNDDVDNNAIQLLGNNNTITLKNAGIVVGKITADSGTTGNKLKFQHGFGQSYFYETSGDFTLEDLDGNQIVKGSAGSVGQGGNETHDELLGYKSLNIRKSLNRYKKNRNNLDENKGRGEIFGSFIKRDQNNQNLALSYEFLNLGVNLINPLENSDYVLSLETARQNFTKDHSINHYSFLTGFNFSSKNFENFILGGATIHNSERTILTNTTTTGKLDIKDSYYSVNVLTGSKFKNEKLIPNIGFTTGYSITPQHKETNYYFWEKKSVLNFSTYLEDEYNFKILNEKNNLNLGWIIDFRKLVYGKEQDYKINGTKATYTQDNDLAEEVTFSTNVEFINKISDTKKLAFTLDGFLSTQETSGFQAGINYIMEL